MHSIAELVSGVALAGDLDAVAAPVLTQIFAQHVEPDADVLVDLTAASLVSAAAMTVLCELAVGGPGRARRVVVVATGLAAETIALGTALTVVGSMSDALLLLGLGSAVPRSAPRSVDIRKMHLRAHIARAVEVVRTRYRLASFDTAFALMSAASQRHNVPLRILAGAVLDVREPEGARWFPGRLPRPAPRLSFAPATTPAATLSRALDRILSRTGSARGSAQSVDPFHAGLTLARQRGFDAAFAEGFAHVTEGTTCALAFHTREQTVIADLATDVRLLGSDQTELLASGVQAVQSTPSLAPDGHCVAVISTHHANAEELPRAAALRQVGVVAGEAGRWLNWYQRTIVFNALEYLHEQATAARP